MSASFQSALLILALSLANSFSHAQEKIVGGTDAADGAYPWTCAMVRRSNSDTYQSQFCGGSLIAPYWVVTAAHCVEGENASNLGIWANINDLSDTTGGEYRNVAAVFVHPYYREDSSGNLVNDIALLLLDAPINSVVPIAYAQTANQVGAGTLVRAIGWGDTESTPAYPTLLQEVDLTIQSIRSVNSDFDNALDNRHLAASEPGKDTCQGDSGGPLFDLDGDGGNPLLVGITSFGLGCADGVAGVYTNVGNYSAFLDSFLSAPPDVDPDLSVTGLNNITLTNGSNSFSRRSGTHYGRRLRGGRSKTRSFYIRNAAGTSPLAIYGLTASGRAFSPKNKPTYVFADSSRRIAIRFKAPGRKKTSKGTVRIVTSDADTPVFSFRVLGKSKRKKGRRRNGIF